MKLVSSTGIFLLIILKCGANPRLPESNNSELFIESNLYANCPPGYSQPALGNMTYCYKVCPHCIATAIQAENLCRRDNGTLASVPNGFVNTYLYQLATQATATTLWLGTKCYNGDVSTCENDDRTPIVYRNFKLGQPAKEGICVSMTAVGPDTQKWSALDCTQQSAFACETRIGGAKLPTCPQDYTEFQGMCYKYVNIAPNFISPDMASAECRKIAGGNLATSGNAEVNNFLLNILNPTPNDQSSLIFGLRCPNVKFNGDTSSCKWDDGTRFGWNAFNPGSPGGPSTSACCFIFLAQWYQNCYPCDSNSFRGYFCQAPMQLL